MGVIKNKSDEVIINNESELITPAIVRQVNDVIDAQVEAAKTSISTLEQNITTLNSGTIPNGGATGQILAKNSATDRDTHWVNAPSGGNSGSSLPSGGAGGQVLAKSADNSTIIWRDLPNATGDYLPLTGGNMTGGINFPVNRGLNFVAQRPANEGGNYSTWISGNALGGFRYIAPIDDFDVNFDFLEGIYTHYQKKALSYAGDYSTNFTARSLVDKAYVDSKTLPNGGSNGQVLTKTTTGQEWQNATTTDISGLLPKAGGTMSGDIDMNEKFLRNIGGITYYNSYLSLEETLFDLQGGIMNYAQTPQPASITDNSLIHKGYVDERTVNVPMAIVRSGFEIVYGLNQDEPENYTLPQSFGLEVYSMQITMFKNSRSFFPTYFISGNLTIGYTLTFEALQEGQYSYMIVIYN